MREISCSPRHHLHIVEVLNELGALRGFATAVDALKEDKRAAALWRAIRHFA